jgi:anti-sigma B factor antagonist
MHVERSMRGSITVMGLVGELDAVTAAQIHTELDYLAPDGGRLLLDLSQVSYRSSLGLRVLLLLYRQARQKRLQLALACVPANLYAVMSATGFEQRFLVTDTLEAAVEALGP